GLRKIQRATLHLQDVSRDVLTLDPITTRDPLDELPLLVPEVQACTVELFAIKKLLTGLLRRPRPNFIRRVDLIERPHEDTVPCLLPGGVVGSRCTDGRDSRARRLQLAKLVVPGIIHLVRNDRCPRLVGLTGLLNLLFEFLNAKSGDGIHDGYPYTAFACVLITSSRENYHS